MNTPCSSPICVSRHEGATPAHPAKPLLPAHLPLLALAVGLILIGSERLEAQEETRQVDVAMARGFQPALTVEGAIAGSTSFKAGSTPAGAASVDNARVSLSAPLPPLSTSVFDTVGITYTEYAFSRNAGTPLPAYLHGLSADIGAIDRIAQDWTLIARVSPGLYNAGSGFSTRGFGIGAFAIAQYQFDPNLTGGFGVGYNSLGHGINRLLPVASIDWKPADGWEVSVGFPRTGVTYTLTPQWKAGAVAEFDGGSYFIKDDPAPRLGSKPSLADTRLDYRSIRTGALVSYEVQTGFSVRLGFGAVVDREANYADRGYKLKSNGTAAYLSGGASYRF